MDERLAAVAPKFGSRSDRELRAREKLTLLSGLAELGGVGTSENVRQVATPEASAIQSIALYLKDGERRGYVNQNRLLRDRSGALRVEWALTDQGRLLVGVDSSR